MLWMLYYVCTENNTYRTKPNLFWILYYVCTENSTYRTKPYRFGYCIMYVQRIVHIELNLTGLDTVLCRYRE